MKRKPDFNTALSLFLIVGMMAALAITSALKLRSPETDRLMLAVSTTAAMLGIINTVLSANARVWTFLFGLADVALMAWVYWDIGVPGNFALHAFYFVPMQFVGFWQWRRRGADARTRVSARRLSRKGLMAAGAALLLGSAAAYLLISTWGASLFGTPDEDAWRYMLDAALLTSNLLGQVLMSLAYVEQWYLWNLTNVCNIVLFSYLLFTGKADAAGVVMVVKYSFYLVNSLNGLRIWLKISDKETEQVG